MYTASYPIPPVSSYILPYLLCFFDHTILPVIPYFTCEPFSFNQLVYYLYSWLCYSTEQFKPKGINLLKPLGKIVVDSPLTICNRLGVDDESACSLNNLLLSFTWGLCRLCLRDCKGGAVGFRYGPTIAGVDISLVCADIRCKLCPILQPWALVYRWLFLVVWLGKERDTCATMSEWPEGRWPDVVTQVGNKKSIH